MEFHPPRAAVRSASEIFTILGASGFIGRNLCASLARAGHRVQGIGRRDALPRANLGHVIYAVGVTGDFRTRPMDTVEAHVCQLVKVLRQADFASLVYLSSTRVYGRDPAGREDDVLRVQPGDPDHLYNLSKAMGESIALHSGREHVHIARLSNVIGGEFTSPNFLDQLVRDACDQGQVVLRSHPQSSRDYVLLDDVLEVLPQLSIHARNGIYNIASGTPVTHGEILDVLVGTTGCSVRIETTDSPQPSPLIDITRVRSEFAFSPRPLLPALASLLNRHERRPCPT